MLKDMTIVSGLFFIFMFNYWTVSQTHFGIRTNKWLNLLLLLPYYAERVPLYFVVCNLLAELFLYILIKYRMYVDRSKYMEIMCLCFIAEIVMCCYMLYKDNKRYVQLCKSFRQTETAYIREKSGEVMLYGNVGWKYILTVPRNKECKRFIVILNGGYFETNVNGDVFAPNSDKKDHEEFMGNVGAFEELANKLASCGYGIIRYEWLQRRSQEEMKKMDWQNINEIAELIKKICAENNYEGKVDFFAMGYMVEHFQELNEYFKDGRFISFSGLWEENSLSEIAEKAEILCMQAANEPVLTEKYYNQLKSKKLPNTKFIYYYDTDFTMRKLEGKLRYKKITMSGYEYEKLGTYPKFNDRIAEDIIGWESTY